MKAGVLWVVPNGQGAVRLYLGSLRVKENLLRVLSRGLAQTPDADPEIIKFTRLLESNIALERDQRDPSKKTEAEDAEEAVEQE